MSGDVPRRFRLVVLESPFGSPDPDVVRRNVAYARAAMRDCLRRGDSPVASHLLYTQEGVLDDSDPSERELGIEAGLAWGRVAEVTVAYLDLGVSDGMRTGIERAEAEGRPVERRRIPGWSRDADVGYDAATAPRPGG